MRSAGSLPGSLTNLRGQDLPDCYAEYDSCPKIGLCDGSAIRQRLCPYYSRCSFATRLLREEIL